MAERTVFDLFRQDVEHEREEHYLHYAPDRRAVWSTARFLETTAAFAEGLQGLGVARGDRVMLLSDNRPEWHLTDLAVLDLGAIDVPVYGTLTPEQIAYQVNDSASVVAVVESPEQMAKFLQIRDRCPSLRHLVQIEGATTGGVAPFDKIVQAGRSDGMIDRFWERAARVDEKDTLTIIYTSGTTGVPKGVELTHRNLVQNVVASTPRVPLHDDDLALEFLPLCHVFERMLGYVYMWAGVRRAYCSIHHVGELIATISPTVFAGVPRFYEKVHDAAYAAAGASATKLKVMEWAVGVGKRFSHQRLTGRTVSAGLAAEHAVADRLVLHKIRAALGGRVRHAVSGGAPLSLAVNEFFHAAGVPLIEGYGLTETSPVITVNAAEPGRIRLGTVGKPLDNVEVEIAPDGELLVRGPSVMKGYWNNAEATAEVFDGRGFFHTGDIAEIDDDGFVLITDRKKELIVTAGGKNVAPSPIEARLKHSPLVDVAVLIGDRRPFIIALLTPMVAEVERLAKQHGVAGAALDEILVAEPVRVAFARLVDEVNASLARYEQIKRFAVIPVTFSVEGGQLTPTLKVRRRFVEEQFADVIEGLYEDVARGD